MGFLAISLMPSKYMAGITDTDTDANVDPFLKFMKLIFAYVLSGIR